MDRPDCPTRHARALSHVDESAVLVAQQVIAPAADVVPLMVVPPIADASAVGSKGDAVTTIGKQMGGLPLATDRVDSA